MEKFDINPFDRSALKSTDVRLLAGRSNELKNIRFILRNASKQKNRIRNIIISGNRGVGKTSFLNLIEGECSNNSLIPIRINLTESNSANSNEFFWCLFNQTINTIFSLGFFKGLGGEIDNAIQSILFSGEKIDQANIIFRTPILRKNYLINNNTTFEFDQFIEDLKFIRDEVIELKDSRFNDNTKLLFLVDETQQIYSNLKIIQDIRFIVQHSDLGIGFVFAGDSSYITSTWESVFGGSYRDFDIINLNYFNDVDSVVEYFKKSLASIGWTENEIEDSRFYKFHKACIHIFQLTSGKPAWINTIASKMFERCMKGESSLLKFDKLAQNDVKFLLESSKEIDSVILDKIDNLPPKYRKWLSELFDCEFSPFKRIYFYSKFKYTDDNFITQNEFIEFCKELIEDGIITLVEEYSDISVGFHSSSKKVDFLDKTFYAFNNNADAIKQWLQISTDGAFQFGMNGPITRFILFINKQMATEVNKVMIINSSSVEREEPIQLSELINNINSSNDEIKTMSFVDTLLIYKACKRISNSSSRQILFGTLKNNISGKSISWNVINFSDKNKVIPFYDSHNLLQKFITAIDRYNTNERNYSLELSIKAVRNPDIEKLQQIIIKSGDKKKFGIIMEDKMDDLVRYYIKESDIEASFKTASFFYDLFEEGYDLSLKEINNSAYVFIAKDKIDEALKLLNEAKRKIAVEDLDEEDLDTSCLIHYNYAIVCIKKDEIEEALDTFRLILNTHEDNNEIIGAASVLKLLKLDDKGNFEFIEIKDGHVDFPSVNCKLFAEENIKILEQHQNHKN